MLTNTGASRALARGARLADRAPLLSIVMPAHDEEGAIGATLGRVAEVAALPELAGRVEVVVVSDGSRDRTFEEARRALGPRLPGTVVELAANVGSHGAIRHGLRRARGAFVAIMAADGQDPPEALPAMLAALRRERAAVAWGRRSDREADRPGARRAAGAWYRAFRRLSGADFPPGGLDFLVVRQEVLAPLLARRSRNTSLHLDVWSLGVPQTYVDYRRGARQGGETSWTLRKRAKLAVDMIAGVSASPIRLAALSGMSVALVAAVAGAAGLLAAWAAGDAAPAWSPALLAAGLTSAPLCAAVALLGEYVWRVLDDVRGGCPPLEARHERVAVSLEAAEERA
jgi:dolichol-phosphate mannosyltransferase